MADEESRPLLDEQARSPSPGPSSGTATRPDQPRRSFELSSESTPLLHRRNDDIVTYGTEQRLSESELVDDNAPAPKNRSRVRWPTVISLVALTTAVLAILIFAFAAPAIVKEYAQQAAVFKPTALSIDSTTEDGIRARVQGDFVMDAGRVKTKSMRDIGRFMTWIAREVETGESDIKVYLPEYGNILVGNAHLPSIKVNIRNGHQTHVDFLTNLTAGDIKGLHSIARDWIEGRLARLSVRGKATLHLKSGLIGLGTQTLTDTVTFEENDFPALPTIDITKLNVHDAAHGALAVDVQVSAGIDSPVALIIPSLEFAVFVPNCSPGDPYILVADAKTAEVQVRPDAPTVINAQGLINQLPDELTKTCPGGNGSPLDFLVSNYVQGLQSTIYVRGADSPSTTTPAWIADLLRSVTVPLPFAGNPLDDLMKNFTMTDTHFSLPNPWAEPGSPESQPTVSALVKVLIGLPDEMNVQVEVPSVRALTNVYYHGEELGVLNIDKWQDANSTRVELEDGSSALLVEFPIKDAPLQVTDNDLLAQVVQEMLFGSTGVILHVAATVDAKVETGLGRFAVHGIPGEGNVPVNIPAGNSIGQINPTIASMELGDTTETSLDVSVRMNFTNPTNYSATIPFFDVEMLFNDTAIAHVFARNLSVVPGNNTNVSIQMTWDPFSNGGEAGVEAGRKFVSSYISGAHMTLSIKTHEGTFPTLPDLGKALSVFSFEVPVPHMSMPRAPGDEDDDDDKPPRFIQEATLHFFSSTAEFTVFSPSVETSITITSMDATAYYDGDEPVGHINYHRSFDVPPGISHSPRLPVDLVLGGVGYDALRKALGQELVLDAVAKVGVRVKNYADIVNYHGNGLAAKVRV
ncbi:uncharacterized protein N7473_005520 [Penicillium subrubescens]|uniref:uncharacterized protein n=1 Tax=Penicillium subrubescens TaxID=1316194 RepID=UPI00254509BF|nr:uncharacterized protein N7473_005520 [Penicillium subrubescens]KAJ5896121.1 hypothetical protein N7473_005520 [Penicillium subrubescens]